jgi:hypothetical protein
MRSKPAERPHSPPILPRHAWTACHMFPQKQAKPPSLLVAHPGHSPYLHSAPLAERHTPNLLRAIAGRAGTWTDRGSRAHLVVTGALQVLSTPRRGRPTTQHIEVLVKVNRVGRACGKTGPLVFRTGAVPNSPRVAHPPTSSPRSSSVDPRAIKALIFILLLVAFELTITPTSSSIRS